MLELETVNDSSVERAMTTGEKISGLCSCGGALGLPVAVGVVSSLAGGDISATAAVVGGVYAMGPASIGASAAALSVMDPRERKTMSRAAALFLGAAVIWGGVGAGLTAGTHKLTSIITGGNKPAVKKIDDTEIVVPVRERE